MQYLFVLAAFNIGKIYHGYNKADNPYDGIQDEYVSSNEKSDFIQSLPKVSSNFGMIVYL